MKRLIALSAVGLSFGIGSVIAPALAADISRPIYREQPPIATPLAYSWTGFYFGGHVGAGWTDSSAASAGIAGIGTTAASGSVFDDRDVGIVGGVQGGYNYQFAPNWVIGVEGDFTWSGLGTSQSGPLLTAAGVPIGGTAFAYSRDLNWLASVRGRLGYTWDRTMLYVTGGAAWADYDNLATASLVNGSVASGNFGSTRSGWVLGGGVEWAMPSTWLGSDWIARIEYLHYDFSADGGATAFSPGPGSASFAFADPSVDVVRVGLSYKFGVQ